MKIEKKIYKYSFNFNASHSYKENKKHSHTFKITLYIQNNKEEDALFYKYENDVSKFIEKYKGTYLNEIPPFDIINPTLENISEYFYNEISKNILDSNDFDLIKLDISDRYTNVVSYGRSIILNNKCISNEKIEKLLFRENFNRDKINKYVKVNIPKVEIPKVNILQVEDIDEYMFKV